MTNQDHVMRAGYVIRKQFAEFLSVMIPAYVQMAEQEWTDISPAGLQVPKRYDALDPYDVGTDDYPAIGLITNRATGYQRIDFDDSGSAEYRSTWLCTLFIATKTRLAMDEDDEGFTNWEQPPRESVISARDDLTGIVKNVLLAYPDLAVYGETSSIVIDESSITVDFIPPMKTGDMNVWVAVTQIGLSLKMREVAWVPPLSEVHKVIAQIGKLGS